MAVCLTLVYRPLSTSHRPPHIASCRLSTTRTALPSLRWICFGPTRVTLQVIPSITDGTGKLVLQESTMHLKLRLLHEEDLPRFFSALTRQGGGLFTVDQCFLRRLKSGEMEKLPQFQPNLTAECDLRWLTVKPASDPEKKG